MRVLVVVCRVRSHLIILNRQSALDASATGPDIAALLTPGCVGVVTYDETVDQILVKPSLVLMSSTIVAVAQPI
jgi:hypothetical protein